MVLELVLARPEISGSPEISASKDRLATLQKNLVITRVGDSDLFNVAYISKVPKLASTVANAVVSEYLTIQSRNGYERYQRVIDLLEEERFRRKTDVETLKKRVLALSTEVTGHDPFSGTELDPRRVGSPLAENYMELTKLDSERAILQAHLQALREAPDQTDLDDLGTRALDFQVESHPTMMQLKAELDALKQRAEAYKSTLKPEVDLGTDVSFQRIQTAQDTHTEAMEKFRTTLREELIAHQHDAVQVENELKAKAIEQQLASLEIKHKLLEAKFKEDFAGIQAGNTKSVELTFAKAELEREEKVFEMIADRKLSMQTESRAPARVSVQQSAPIPLVPVTKVPVKMLVFACALCVAAPYGLAVLREMSIRRISDVEQLSRETTLRVVGEVSHFPIRRAAANGHMLPPKMRRQMFVYLESIDSLRTNLALTEPKSNSRVMVVTSAAAAEGKTCLATSLAVSIANAENRPTLVIDGDMRSPDVASVLGTRDRPGLAELLANQASLSDVVQRVGKTNTYVIAAGRLKGNPHHVIREERVGPLVTQLRGQFSTIIIDTPPIFGGSESLVFAKLADSVLVSVMRDVSRLQQLQGAIDRLERAGASVAGTVLNGTSSNSYAYNYGYGYYSGRLDVAEA
jgi:capsular exopolysaccharide synthesis family protein